MIALIKLALQIIIINDDYSKTLFGPQVAVETSMGISSEFSFFLADTLAAHKEMCLSQRHLAELVQPGPSW